MSLSKHPNVLRVRGTWLEGRKLYIALRLMRAGSISDCMRYKFTAGIDEESIRCILKQALDGLKSVLQSFFFSLGGLFDHSSHARDSVSNSLSAQCIRALLVAKRTSLRHFIPSTCFSLISLIPPVDVHTHEIPPQSSLKSGLHSHNSPNKGVNAARQPYLPG